MVGTTTPEAAPRAGTYLALGAHLVGSVGPRSADAGFRTSRTRLGDRRCSTDVTAAKAAGTIRR